MSEQGRGGPTVTGAAVSVNGKSTRENRFVLPSSLNGITKKATVGNQFQKLCLEKMIKPEIKV